MRILIAEDDLLSRKFMQKFLSRFGTCDIAADGLEAVDSILISIKEKKYYDLICLDIMMPKIDGLTVLKSIREIEKQNDIPEEKKAKVIMTTCLSDQKTVMDCYNSGCEAYAWKPIDGEQFVVLLKRLNLL